MAQGGESSDILRHEIEAQSQNEAAEILKQAEGEVRSIIKQAEAEAANIRSHILEGAKKQAGQVRRRILSGVQLEIKKQQLRNREKLMDQVLDRVRRELEAFRSDPAYRNVLIRWALEGMNAVESDSVILICGKKEADILNGAAMKAILGGMKKETGRTVHASIETSDTKEGGILVLSSDRRVRFDNRFPARLRRMEQEIRLEVAKTVFAGE